MALVKKDGKEKDMYTVYYDKNSKYADQSSNYVKIHKGDKNGKGGCGYHTKNDNAVKNHTGERPLQEFTTLIKACEYVEEKTGKLSSKFFCKYCFGKEFKWED